jgi:hypothetical protein
MNRVVALGACCDISSSSGVSNWPTCTSCPAQHPASLPQPAGSAAVLRGHMACDGATTAQATQLHDDL